MGRKRLDSEYLLPKDIYMSTLWYIRGYYRWKLQREEVLEGSPPPPDGQPRGSSPGDPTYRAAARLVPIGDKLKPIEDALLEIPEEYRAGILAAIIERQRYPDYAAVTTWKRWRQRLVYHTAINLGYYQPKKISK